jgi:hypothetical protein
MYVVYFQSLAFQPANPDGTAAGKEEVVLRGDPVPEYVLPFQLSALSAAGMIVEVGDKPDPRIRPLEAEPLPPVSADNPPGPIPALANLSGDPDDLGSTEAPEPLEKPKPNDSRAAWEAYGVSLGMNQFELEAEPNKAAVIDAVNARDNS